MTAINHKGWHLGGCERHGDDDPANEGCKGNCPRRLHAEIDRLTRENASLRTALTDLFKYECVRYIIGHASEEIVRRARAAIADNGRSSAGGAA